MRGPEECDVGKFCAGRRVGMVATLLSVTQAERVLGQSDVARIAGLGQTRASGIEGCACAAGRDLRRIE